MFSHVVVGFYVKCIGKYTISMDPWVRKVVMVEKTSPLLGHVQGGLTN